MHNRPVLTRRAAEPPDELASLIRSGARYQALDLDADPVDTAWIPADAIVVISSPPAREPGAAGQRERRFVDALGDVARVVYLSSTGVYPRGEGGVTDERVPAEPAAAHGAARLAAETAVLRAAAARDIPAVSLRIAGIYGPGRGVVARMRAGNYRIIGDGRGYVSRIHVHDLVSAIVAAATIEPLPHDVVNVADDEPCPSVDYADAVARRLGLPSPPRVPLDQVSARVAALVGSNRRVDNARLKGEFGVSLRYPSCRDWLDELA